MKVAVLDIGSNTTKILVAEKDQAGIVHSLAEKSYPCRLASELSGNQACLSANIVQSISVVIDSLLSYIKPFNPVRIRVLATEALRRTGNRELLTEELLQQFGLCLEVLSGDEEANLIGKGLMTDPALSFIPGFCAIDLGGGSMEVIEVVNNDCRNVVSLPLGAVVLAENFLGDLSLKPSMNDIGKLQNYVSQMLEDRCYGFLKNASLLVGSGGSVVFLRQLISSLNQAEMSTQNILHATAVNQVMEQVSVLSLSERITQFPQLPADRADVFPAALVVILELLKFCNLSSLTHSFKNLRYGAAKEMLDDLLPLN
jgi:exopolyphosphatase/guanosine-5'-triphosphate,3'-diphosphate pyrophosphatase